MTAYQLESVGWCPAHRKHIYGTRRAAKRVCRILPHRKGMREYRCTAVDYGWHVGHQPRVVMLGLKTAREVYGSTGYCPRTMGDIDSMRAPGGQP